MASTAGQAEALTRRTTPTLGVLLAVILAAWALSVWVELSGVAVRFHHHTLYESGLPFWSSALIMLAGWQIMTAAMMLPSSLGFIRMYAAAAKNAPELPASLALFLAAYFAVWSAFALLAFAGDMQVHRAVDTWPWLAAHSQVVIAATFGLAAIYQLTPLKDACLKACRHPGMYLARHYQRGVLNGFTIGLGHALFCVGCCWALMLVMFAAGVAHLAWMGALGVVMLLEKGARNGDRLVLPVGGVLAALALVSLFAPHAIPGL